MNTAKAALESALSIEYYTGVSSIEMIMKMPEEYQKTIDLIEKRLIEFITASDDSLAERQFAKGVRYKIKQMKDKLKEAEKRVEKRNKAARDKRALEKAKATPSTDPVLMMREMRKLMQLQQMEERSHSKKEKFQSPKNPNPKSFEEALENFEHIKDDPVHYNFSVGLLKKQWFENKVGSEASRELTSEFMTPTNADVFGYSENGKPLNMLEYLDAHPADKKYTCETEEEYNHRIELEARNARWAAMTDTEKQAYAEAEDEKRKIAAEEIRLQKEEWEKTAAIKRKVDKLLAEAKAKEELKCLIPKKSTVPNVEESLDNTA